ncbi:MAG TPA: O-methyltransferase [Flavobacteriales bacterium]|nr:O-methyltransferase [Flavobacteriales bacterium]HNU56761.1 O-methyltransferase [Flavobacteriales bacterium]
MNFLPEGIDRYCSDHSSPEPALLAELAAETHASIAEPRMLSGHLQGRFLSMLSKLARPHLALEIGTYTGYGTLCLAEGLAPDGSIHTIDVHAPVAAVADRYFRRSGLHERIHQHVAPAQEVIPGIEGAFDLVFIDADKSNYPRYLELVIDRLVPGGLIIADNVLWSGKVLQDKAALDTDTRGLMTYAEKVAKDPRLESVLLPLRDGLLVSRRK